MPFRRGTDKLGESSGVMCSTWKRDNVNSMGIKVAICNSLGDAYIPISNLYLAMIELFSSSSVDIPSL